MKALDQSQTGRPREHHDVLPLLVSNKDFPRGFTKLAVDTPMLKYTPDTSRCLYLFWYVKLPPRCITVTLSGA
jgi:hypothetical protein